MKTFRLRLKPPHPTQFAGDVPVYSPDQSTLVGKCKVSHDADGMLGHFKLDININKNQGIHLITHRKGRVIELVGIELTDHPGNSGTIRDNML